MNMFENKQANKTGESSKWPLKISSYFGCKMETAMEIKYYICNSFRPQKSKSSITKAENCCFDH